jgi:hypothetical protein
MGWISTDLIMAARSIPAKGTARFSYYSALILLLLAEVAIRAAAPAVATMLVHHIAEPRIDQGDTAMSRFDNYATQYSSIHMRRENGILEMRFHTDDGPLRWGLVPHGELPMRSLPWRATATTAW